MSLSVVDIFAGAGGFSTGAIQAGLTVTYAVNHWQTAVTCHSINHPSTTHACEDVLRIDWSSVPTHDILLASPACQGHSRARGKDKPHHDALRATAWSIPDYLEHHKPKALIVENVPEFTRWAQFPAWMDVIRAYGYSGEPTILNSMNVGVPQDRKRVFIVFTKSKSPIRLTTPSEPIRPANDIIQWENGDWRSVYERERPLSSKTLAQIEAGKREQGSRFIVPYYGVERTRLMTDSVDEPLRPVTTVDRCGLVNGDMFRMMSVDEYRAAMGFPPGYWLPSKRADAIKLMGNAVCPPLAKWILEQVTVQL